jgi:hypothetical protein
MTTASRPERPAVGQPGEPADEPVDLLLEHHDDGQAADHHKPGDAGATLGDAVGSG